MASGLVCRANRPNTWLHRPSLRRKVFLANSEPSTHGTKRTCQSCCSMSASLIGRLGSSAFRLSTNSSVDVAHGLSLLFGLGTKGPSIMGFEDEVEQSFGRPFGRPCRQCDGRFKRTYELTPSIVP